FYLDNRLLLEGPDLEGLKWLYGAGYKVSVSARHVNAQVYGDAAVLTLYIDGSVAHPDGTVYRGTWRYSATMIKQQDGWKIVHYHVSPLTSSATVTHAQPV
ncbi:MAG: nuclear transport factor 2 family protein, partial [Anaerolineae bacterium]|nr:nuclear transport factor 2 family protein [Anaerolineae bacterium]